MNFDNQCMMNQPVNRSNGHHVVGKDVVPPTERLIGGVLASLSLVAISNQLKEYRGFSLRLFDIAQIVDN